MNIILIGCGKVGVTIVEQLSAEGHDIVVIDLQEEKLEAVSSLYDVMTLTGNGASFTIQQEAGISKADLLIAVTNSDELNLLCCLIAKKSGRCQTIARVRNSLYNREIKFIMQQLGISMVINPELTTAREIARILRFPSAMSIDSFAKGRAELVTYQLLAEYGISDMRITNVMNQLKSNILICGVERGEDFFIPNGNFVLKDNDCVSIMGSQRDTADFFRKIGISSHRVKTALIIGGGTTCYYLASMLIEDGIRVRVIEQDITRCEELCDLLPKANIINGNGTDQRLLMREGLQNVESVISLTGVDEENLLISLFAKKHSNAKVIAKVSHLAYNDIISSLGIGSIVYPKDLTANIIIKYVRSAQNTQGNNVETLYKIMNDKAEALEFIIRPDCPITNIPLAQLQLKPELLVCCINREGTIIIPRGQDCIQTGDTVVIITTQKGLGDISDILA